MPQRYNYEWDRNAPLNEIMLSRQQQDAEELFVACFERYVADQDGVFSKKEDFAAVLEASSDLENLSLAPLFQSIDLLSLVWRHETRWGNHVSVFTEDNAQRLIMNGLTGLSDYLKFLRQITLKFSNILSGRSYYVQQIEET